MTATSTAGSTLPPVRTTCHVPLSLMTSISEETINLWLKLGALEKLEQAVLDGYGDQLCGKTSRIPQVNKFLKQVPLFQNKIREIHSAVSEGRLRDVQHLIDRKKLAFCRDHNGASPLHKAVIFGHQDIIEYLVMRYGGVIHIRDNQGRTALHYAAFLLDCGEIYKYLLANGSDERAMDVYGRQPSYYLEGQSESALRQLQDGSALNGLRKIKPRHYGQVSSGKAFTNSHRPMVTKSYIREVISEGNVASLEEIVLNGQGDRLLGETSSVPKIQSFLNIVPMYMERIYDVHRAVMRDQLEDVVILLENKKLAMARDQLGATPLHKAVLFGHYKIAHYISQQFPETLNVKDTEGRTPLHYAAALKDNKNMYLILTEAGANKGVFDTKGKTPDYYAQYPEHLNLEEVIKKCHKVNANYLANTANRIKGKSPIRQTSPPSHGNLNSPRSDMNNSKENSQSNESSQQNELVSLLQIDKRSKRLDMSTANFRRWSHAKDMDKLAKAVLEGYGEKVLEACPYEDEIRAKLTELVDKIHSIHCAVSSNSIPELQSYFEDKDFVLAKDKMGNTPLHKAVLLQKIKTVEFLIEEFPETTNAKNKNGLTALHYAAAMSRKDGHQLYKMLLQAGADRKVRDNHGRTPDYYKTHLITLPNKGTTRSRTQGSRHLDTLNRFSKQSVFERMTTALQQGDVDILEELVLEGHGKFLVGKTSWNEDVRTFLKELPSYLSAIHSFHKSIKADDIQTVKAMVSSNPKLLSTRDTSGALPIHIATAKNSLQVLHYFLTDHPAIRNGKDNMGRTSLHIASLQKNQELYKILKDAGLDTKITDHKGKSAEYYFQNEIEENRTENDSSKSSGNSISESIQHKVNKKHVSKKHSRRFVKASVTKDEKNKEKYFVGGIDNKNANLEINKQKSLEDETARQEENNADECPCTDENQGNQEEDEENLKENEEDCKRETGEDENINPKSEENRTEFDGDETPDLEELEKTKDELEAVNGETHQDLQSNGISDLLHKDENNEEEQDISTSPIQIDGEVERTENEDVALNEESNEIEDNDAEVKEENPEESSENCEVNAVSEVENENHLNSAGGSNEKEENIGLENGVTQESDENEMNDENNENNTDIVLEEENVEPDCNKEEKSVEISDGEATEIRTTNNDLTDDNVTDNDGTNDNETKDEETTDDVTNEETEEVLLNEETANEEIKDELPKEEIKDELTNDETSNEEIKDDVKEDINNELTNEEIVNLDATTGTPTNENATDEGIESEEGTIEKITNIADIDDKVTNDDVTDEDITNSEVVKEEDTNNAIENVETDENQVSEMVTPKTEDESNIDENSGKAQNDSNTNNNLEEESLNEEVTTNSDPQLLLDSNNDKENNEAVNDIPKDGIDVTNSENGTEQIDTTSNHWNIKNNGIEEKSHQIKDHLDELIEHWIDQGDLLRLEHVVLAGQGDRLIERTSDDKQVQDFLDLVPIYMAKIRAVHEAVVKGLLREVRSVLTRKRFALSRDHVGASPLHLAILHGHTDVSTYIISHFPETMDGPDNEGRTPLHYATALRDNGTLYKLLKAAGADENAEDKSGHSAKYYMSHPGQLTLEQLLEPYSVAE